MDLGLSGRKAIVAGATKGIGLAVAIALRREGASVAICGRDADRLEAARTTVASTPTDGAGPDATGSDVVALAADLADRADTDEFVRRAIDALGGLDIYIHCASGFGHPGVDGWRHTLEIDVLAAVGAVEAALPALEASGVGSILLIGSTASMQWFGRPGVGATGYGAAKAAQRVYVNELAQTLGRRRIRANAVSPGSTLAERGTWAQVRDENPELWQALVRQFPFRRLVSDEEVARVVAFVASPAGSGINGTHVVVDGGQNKAVQ